MKLSKELFNFIRRLNKSKNNLDECYFCLEGEKSIKMMLQKRVNYKAIVCVKEFYDNNRGIFLEFVDNSKIFFTTKAELNTLSNLETNNTVLALLFKCDFRHDISQLNFNKSCIVLDKIQNPANLGSIVRIAHWFGIEQIVCSLDSVKIFNNKAIQASMGSFLFVRVYYVDLQSFLLRTRLSVYGASTDASNINLVSIPYEAIIVFGNESQGISEPITKLINNWFSIPRVSNCIDSLNVSIAAGIICHKWRS